jgi:hypothetical protein
MARWKALGNAVLLELCIQLGRRLLGWTSPIPPSHGNRIVSVTPLNPECSEWLTRSMPSTQLQPNDKPRCNWSTLAVGASFPHWHVCDREPGHEGKHH